MTPVFKWPTRFLLLATHIAQWSKDPSTRVGAVIADRKRRVTGLGYNGFPRGVDDTAARYDDREMKYKFVVHAEANAILNSHHTEGCTLYCNLPPCNECAKLIIQAGIVCVWFELKAHHQRLERDPTWGSTFAITSTMLREANVSLQGL